eukprot:CAMPEP_0172858136 /NCGR_PEP_ID=MMETSP1075-20121228/65813_1 /TAXON_ID=2916 /ORGANISM="Ceratium fusus, Strain PA161109" /LENGTH=74 /DNA_ID=CAMNT_0013705599 /DNA_START=85 /DNA_END=309 /DNA_ORIENTATION=-
MHANDLVLNNCSHGQVVERICEQFPDSGSTVGTHTFIEKSINLGNLSALMVAAEQCDAFLVADFAQKHQRNGLH